MSYYEKTREQLIEELQWLRRELARHAPKLPHADPVSAIRTESPTSRIDPQGWDRSPLGGRIGYSYFRVIRNRDGEVTDLEWTYQNDVASRINRLPSGHDCAGLRMLAKFPELQKTDLWTHYKSLAETGKAWQGEFHNGEENFDSWFRITGVRPSRDTLALIFEDVTARRELEARHVSAEARARDEGDVNETLYRIANALTADLEIEKIVQRLTDEATAVCRAEFGAFFYNVLNAKGESYMLYTLSGVPREAFANFAMPRSTQIFGPTFSGMGVVRLDDVTQDPRYETNALSYGMPTGHLPVRSYLAIPVVNRSGEVMGGLFFGHSKPGVFTERDERILSAIAPQAAVALDNAKLFDAARRERIRAEEANRAKDEFLASVSHELRTPLNAMLGWTRLVRIGNLSEEKRDRALETIERNARLQTQLIEDLLDVSRIVSGKLRLNVRPVELASVVTSAVEAVRPAAEAKDIRMHQVLDPDGPIVGDQDRLLQIVSNLLTNAVKFTQKGGWVRIHLQRVDSSVQLSVSDNGLGISPDFLPFVFERFRQAEGGIAPRQGGLGLGLAIVKHLVDLHGGTIQAHSDGEGRGAQFVVRLPVMPTRDPTFEPAIVRPADRFDCSAKVEGLRILVVEDEADARELVARTLEQCGAEVLIASSAQEALESLRRRRPDVLVSDIGMPTESGYDLIRKIRSLPSDEGGRTPAVALTAYARMEDRTKALVAGFDSHVAKPVELAELLIVIANLVGRFSKQ